MIVISSCFFFDFDKSNKLNNRKRQISSFHYFQCADDEKTRFRHKDLILRCTYMCSYNSFASLFYHGILVN